MFGKLAAMHFRRHRGTNQYRPRYRTAGLKRFALSSAPYPRGRRLVPRKPIRSANRTVTTLHRIEQYNGGTGQYAVDFVSGPADVYKHVAPLVSEFPGTGPYKQLYRQFRVLKVILEFFPSNIQGSLNEGTEEDFCNLYTPMLYTAINRTSAAFADNITKMASCNNMQSVIATKYHKRVFTPCTLDQMYDTAVTTGYNPEYKQWISTEYTSVPHFGADVLLSSTGSAPKCAFKYRMRTTVVVQWKNRKPNTDLS